MKYELLLASLNIIWVYGFKVGLLIACNNMDSSFISYIASKSSYYWTLHHNWSKTWVTHCKLKWLGQFQSKYINFKITRIRLGRFLTIYLPPIQTRVIGESVSFWWIAIASWVIRPSLVGWLKTGLMTELKTGFEPPNNLH